MTRTTETGVDLTLPFTVLTSGTDTTYPKVTASITPTKTPVIVAAVFSSPSTYPSSPTCSGCGLTWTLKVSEDWASRRVLAIWEGTGTPSAGTLTLSITDVGGATGMAYLVMEADNIASIGTWASTIALSGNVANQSRIDASGSGDVTLAIHAFEATGGIAVPRRGQALVDLTESGDVRRLVAYLDTTGDIRTRVAWSGTGGDWGAAAVLITIASGTDVAASQSAYIAGTADTSDSQSAYIKGSVAIADSQSAYIEGATAGGSLASSQQAYISGLTYFPLTETWTGNNEDEWRRSHWVTGAA